VLPERTRVSEQEIKQQVIETALKIIGEKGWRATSLPLIADAMQISLPAFYAVCDSREALVTMIFEHFDVGMLKEADEVDASGSARDRLFDMIMLRLEAMEPYKPAVAAMIKEVRGDVAVHRNLRRSFSRSLQWLLEGAHLHYDGLKRTIVSIGLSRIYLSTLRVWIKDDDAGLAKTMAHLDRELRQTESFIRRAKRFAPSRKEAEAV